MLRREYKYLVPNYLLDDLRRDLSPFVEYDKYAINRPEKHYTVRSIYYDTLGLDYYNEKLAGTKVRKKIRIRGYNEPNDSNVVFLEIKRKLENFIDKHRTQVYYRNLEDLFYFGDIDSYIIQKNDDALDNAKRFFFHMNRYLLKPVSLVVYNREAFFSKFDSNIRITLDRNLRCFSLPAFINLYDETILKPALSNHFVFEIKFYLGFSEHFQKIINKYRLTRLAVSKYVICVEADKNLVSKFENKQFAFNNPVWKEQINCKEAI